ncbi:MAG TPA: cellulase family glycosylhydrolase, partial [Bryobacteraceae bacterium]|nr:cellulase family glycosylhydrolase [Bryobacteraceae bacterium]
MRTEMTSTTNCRGLLLLLSILASQVAAQPAGEGYLRTSGKLIVNAEGAPVRIAGVNWFGMETSTFAPHGLWVRGYKDMLEQIRSLGFNTVRIPFSNQLFDPESQPNGIDFNLNPDLRDLQGIEILDRLISHAGKIGLKVILDRHRPDANAQSQLWYTVAYPESRWIADWKMLAARYKGDSAVIGVDLHNEPRSPACWGCGEASLDWRLAAQRAGNAILSVNPNLLIIVQGVELHDNESYWWGGNLKGAAAAPVLLNVDNRLVYSPHDYPSSISPQVWFTTPDYPANLPAVWDAFWGYLARTEKAPVLIGEFGSRLESESDRKWFDSILSYIRKNGIHWTFWSWNPNSQDTGGLLLADWTNVDQTKLSKLKAAQSATATEETKGTDVNPAPPATPAAPSSPIPPEKPADIPQPAAFCRAVVRTYGAWANGSTVDVQVTNTGAGPVDGWTITWQFSSTQTIRELWNGRWVQRDNKVSVTDVGWNAKLPE